MKYHIKTVQLSRYHALANGLVEALNKSLMDDLKKNGLQLDSCMKPCRPTSLPSEPLPRLCHTHWSFGEKQSYP